VLQARLEAFEAANPGVRLEVRIKAASGPGGLLASLSAASSAAPVALPDVIALQRVDLESAALKELLVPLTDLSPTTNDPDWFEYATALGMLQEDHFGLPFAGDTLVMIYRPSQIGNPPPDFASALLLEEALTFPAASSEALFTMALYQADGGLVQDEEGMPILEVSHLSAILSFFQEAEIAGLTPFWLTQYDSFEAALDPFQENRAQMAVSWASTFLSDPPMDTLAAAFFTPTGVPFTLADGWIWALATPQDRLKDQSIDLIEFLSNPEFLAEWTQANGYLPTRPSGLEAWPPSPLRELILETTASAQIIPPTNVIATLGPQLQEATVQVLKQQLDPSTAAREAASAVNGE
jgi:ABC-type glycerol-3-phosphate transport system substrate-binding protein